MQPTLFDSIGKSDFIRIFGPQIQCADKDFFTNWVCRRVSSSAWRTHWNKCLCRCTHWGLIGIPSGVCRRLCTTVVSLATHSRSSASSLCVYMQCACVYTVHLHRTPAYHICTYVRKYKDRPRASGQCYQPHWLQQCRHQVWAASGTSPYGLPSQRSVKLLIPADCTHSCPRPATLVFLDHAILLDFSERDWYGDAEDAERTHVYIQSRTNDDSGTNLP